jgi:hypothetical protein
MEDKLHHFFSDNDFDFETPHSGHFERFQNKLNQKKITNITSLKWLSVAASITLLLGFYLGSVNKSNQIDLEDVSPKMEEVQTYFVSTINQELKSLEKNRSLETETIIENALDQLEDLEDDYNHFVNDLNRNNNPKEVISKMINNYQKRLEILENTLLQIEYIKNPNLIKDEIYL